MLKRFIQSLYKHPSPIKQGDVIHASFGHLLIPFGILSGAIWGLWAVVLCVPLMGWINKRELMLEQISRWDSATWLMVLGIPLAFLIIQLAFRLWIRKRRIVVGLNSVRIEGVLRTKEVLIDGVTQVVQRFDMHALSSDLYLHYYSDTRVQKVSGWLMSSRQLKLLADYITLRNQHLQAEYDIQASIA